MIELPKRLTPPAAPGSLLKGVAASAPQSRIPPEKGGRPDYLALIRQLPCLYCGQQPCGEAAHISFSSAQFGKTNSFGKRAHDSCALPLCRDDHLNAKHAQHKGNEEAFWLALGIDPYFTAKRLWEQRSDFVAMENVVRVAIANRTKAPG